MKKIFLILICFSGITTYSQFNFSSSKTETLYKTINNNQISFTIIHKNNNGVESKRCILNNSIAVDCKIVADCFNKNECKEIENILKTEKKENKEQLKENKIDIFTKLYTNKSEVFIGEQLSVISKIYIKNGVNIRNTNISPITYNGFWEDELKVNTNNRKQENINGINYTVIKFRHSVLTPQKSGTLSIPSSEMETLITKNGKFLGYDVFGRQIFQNQQQSQILKTSTKKIKVKELPKPEAKHFYGTVSEKFTIKTNIDRTKLKTSEAISFKLTFRGNGNINMLEPFELKFPSSFEVFEPSITDKTYVGNNNTGGTKTFEYILIPREKGDFTIPEIKFNYFNPKTEKYIKLNTKEHLISVEKGKQYIPADTTQNGLQNLDLLENLGFSSITKRQFISQWYSFSYWIIFTSMIISYLVYFILSKRNINPIEIKRRKSTKIAIKRLKNASFCLKNGNFDQFFEEIEKSLWGYFADKFEVNSSELSKETIDLYFSKINIKIETKNNFISLLNICEFARYSPSKDRNQQMEKTLENAKEIIIEVESDMKKK